MIDIRDSARIALAFWDGETAPRGAKKGQGIGGAMEDLRRALKASNPMTDEEIDQAWETIYKKLVKQKTGSMDWVRAGIEFAEKLHGIRK